MSAKLPEYGRGYRAGYRAGDAKGARRLRRENASLRAALDSAIVLLRRWNKNDVTDDVVIETRKAIDAARKEAQP